MERKQNPHTVKHAIQKKASELGFFSLGITNQLEPSRYKHYLKWIKSGMAHNMWYLSESTRMQKRANVKQIFPDAKSVWVGTFSYNTRLDHPSDIKFARYGWGRDYHKWIPQKFRALQTFMREDLQLTFSAKVCVDTAPILERDFARAAGVGWIGKNTMLMHQKGGSYLLLGVMLTDLVLPEDQPITAHCGSCTACLDACPTDAFEAPYKLNPNKCISYQTLENRDETTPEAMHPHLEDWVAGCDICQEVCPWNHKAQPSKLDEVLPKAHTGLSAQNILDMDQNTYRDAFAGTSFMRVGLQKMKHNVRSALKVLPHAEKSKKPHR